MVSRESINRRKAPVWAARLLALAGLAAMPALASHGQQAATADVQEVVVSTSRLQRWLAGIDAVSVQIDNDLFAGGQQDRDYTGGMSVAIAGPRARDGWLSLDGLLVRVDRALGVSGSTNTEYARQLGVVAFTPENTEVAEVQADDRPYASMLFLANGRVAVDEDEMGVWTSSLTLGVLGLSLTEQLHGAVHDLVGSLRPRGYQHQIAAGGEPTARYMLARQKLWIATPNGRLDVKTSVQGSVGFLTETSAAVSLRMGRFDSPWWGFSPELTDYMAAPVPMQALGRRGELYVFAGARIKARAYNAFLQGQFRDSAVRYSYDEIAPLLVEGWLGLVMQLMDQTRLSYSLHYQSKELRQGLAARDTLWGAVQLSHSF